MNIARILKDRQNGKEQLRPMKRINHFSFGFSAGVLLAGGIWLVWNQARMDGIEPHQPSRHPAICVQVTGAVANPGVYFMNEDSRLMDALAAAGGLLPEANWSGLNLAATLYDTQKIEILSLSGTPSHDQTTVSTVISLDMPTPEGSFEADRNVQSSSAVTYTPPAASDVCPEEAASGVFIWPTDSHSLSGNDYSYNHPGIDIAAGEGSPVYAADSGMVRLEGSDNSGYGNMIEIDHGNGYSTVYAHLNVIGVRAGQRVCSGQWIGAAGSTGNSTGAHLHFEVIQDGAYIDPWSVLPLP